MWMPDFCPSCVPKIKYLGSTSPNAFGCFYQKSRGFTSFPTEMMGHNQSETRVFTLASWSLSLGILILGFLQIHVDFCRTWKSWKIYIYIDNGYSIQLKISETINQLKVIQEYEATSFRNSSLEWSFSWGNFFKQDLWQLPPNMSILKSRRGTMPCRLHDLSPSPVEQS